MPLSMLLRFLVGDRKAILTIAQTPHALWIGLLFVLGAGLAREYDKESLFHEPWHLLLPLAASLLTSFVLFCLFYTLPVHKTAWPAFGPAYRSFLQVFWMTAPMAWLYAFPWERIYDSPGDATTANLWTLGLVSAWRVLLITRVLSVLFRMDVVRSFFLVMLYSHIVAIISLLMLPFPVINLMGGVQLGESEQLIAGIAGFIISMGFLAGPVWLVGSMVACALARPRWELGEQTTIADAEQADYVQRLGSAGGLALALIALGLALLPLTQTEQMRRYKAETLLKSGEIDAALAFMSEHEPSQFPPHWDPPPRVGYKDHQPDLMTVAERIIEAGAADWVREAYIRKLYQHIWYRSWSGQHVWSELAKSPEIIRSLHFRPSQMLPLLRALELLLALDESLTDDDRAAIEAIIGYLREQEQDRFRYTAP